MSGFNMFNSVLWEGGGGGGGGIMHGSVMA